MRPVNKKILRVTDANYNRAKEALRVCEDISRFVLDDKSSTAVYKKIRHQLTAVMADAKWAQMVRARDIERDVGKASLKTEFKRSSVADIFWANSQRAKESTRVLEEFGKLIDRKNAEGLKKIRYQLYALERKIFERCTALSDPGYKR